MGDIKFRGYNEINKKMLNWNELLDTNLKNIFTMQKKDTGIILMQYTGLHDKNGKEIYEGDIVQQFDIKENGIIKYKYGQFGINSLGMFWNIHPTKLEVIGNVWDNPNLLEKESD